MEKGSTLTVPIAIIIAGLLIAGAVYFSNKNSATPGQTVDQVPTTIPVTDLAIRPISDKDYVRGNPGAKVVIVEYSDTECPFCKQFHATMKSLTENLAKDGTIAWVYRNFPIKQRHPKAMKESEALLCAGKIGGNTAFWNYTDRIYEVTPANDGLDPAQLPVIAKYVGLNEVAFNTCLSSGEMTAAVEADYEDAVQSGGSGTPYNVFVASKAFDKEEVEGFLITNILKYRFPVELFAISSDNMRVAVSGSMPLEFMEELVAILSK